MRLKSKKWLLGAVSAALSVLALSIAAVSPATAADPDQPPSIVEDFSYPGSAEIEASKHIKLISGDGHIMLAPCGSATDLIQVESYNNVEEALYCFKVTGAKGLLQLEIPKVFFIWSGDEPVTAKITVNGAAQAPITVAANDGEPIGAADPQNHGVLLELKV